VVPQVGVGVYVEAAEANHHHLHRQIQVDVLVQRLLLLVVHDTWDTRLYAEAIGQCIFRGMDVHMKEL
jgi:hypothetical protein